MPGIILLFILSLMCWVATITNADKNTFFNWLLISVTNTGFLVLVIQIRNSTHDVIGTMESMLNYIMGGLHEIHKVLKLGLIEEDVPENEQDNLGKLS